MNIFMGILELCLAGYWGWWAYAAFVGIFEPTKLLLLCVGIVATLSLLEHAIRSFMDIP